MAGINISRRPNRVVLLHLVPGLYNQEVLRSLGDNVPKGVACTQMLEVFGHISYPSDRLYKCFGAFGFLVSHSDMVWQTSYGNLLAGVGEGLQAGSLA